MKIFITNLPSFYKINLYNRLASNQKIFVVFTHDCSSQRNSDFYEGSRNFDYLSLGKYSLFVKIKILVTFLQRNNYDRLIIGGWDQFEFWLAAFFFPVYKNAIVVESSYLESSTSGFKGLVKKIFLRRISSAYASGHSQKKLLLNLGFDGKIIITKGVGVFNINKKNNKNMCYIDKVENFIYIGRLSPEKNLLHLIETFNMLPSLKLNIVGFGPLEYELKTKAKSNIFFHGAIENKKLPAFFECNQVLILPSLIEPWGLVVEEAFNNGLPVIVSNRVGCVDELVQENENGLIFNIENPDALYKSVLKISNLDFYFQLRDNVSKLDFDLQAQYQVNSYND